MAQEFATENHFEFSMKKCVYISPSAEDCITIQGTPIERVKSFTYLGIIFTIRGIDTKAQLEKAQQKCLSAISMIQSIGFNGGGFSLKVKILLYKALIRSRMEYGLALAEIALELCLFFFAMKDLLKSKTKSEETQLSPEVLSINRTIFISLHLSGTRGAN